MEISESDPNNLSETLNPTEDTMDDAYTILLSDEEPEKKVWLLTNFPFESYYLLIVISQEERNGFCITNIQF